MRATIVVAYLMPVLIGSGFCQRPSFGRCPDVNPMANFDIRKFLGEWTEVERSFYIFESQLSCTKVNFTLLPKNDTLKVDVIYKMPWRQAHSQTTYEAKNISKQPGVFNMLLETDLPQLLARIAPGSGEYTVLDTDYSTYALIYACTDLRLVHADFVWVLGRERDLTALTRAHVYGVLDENKISRERLLLTNHKECLEMNEIELI